MTGNWIDVPLDRVEVDGHGASAWRRMIQVQKKMESPLRLRLDRPWRNLCETICETKCESRYAEVCHPTARLLTRDRRGVRLLLHVQWIDGLDEEVVLSSVLDRP